MKTYYYHDQINDDFGANAKNDYKTPKDFKYVSKNPFFYIFKYTLRGLFYPLVFLMLETGFLYKIKNRKVLRKVKKQGYFMYFNHTDDLIDAYAPSVINYPRCPYIVTSPRPFAIKPFQTVIKMLGGYPIASSIEGMKNYLDGITHLVNKKKVIAIYPEAHTWPYYTDIRPFGKQSFHYPVDNNTPCFAATNIYVQRKLKFIKTPKVVCYINGPFYPDMSLPKDQRVQKLRDEIYSAMKKRINENPKYNVNNYVYTDDPSKVGIVKNK